MDGSGNMRKEFGSENLRERRHYKNRHRSIYLHIDVQNGLGSLKVYKRNELKSTFVKEIRSEWINESCGTGYNAVAGSCEHYESLQSLTGYSRTSLFYI
jgi:hypothetical protein